MKRPAPSVLLVIDIQDSFKARAERWAHRSNPAFEANVTRLIDAFRTRGHEIIYVLHQDDDVEFSPISDHYRLQDFLSPLPGEVTLHKTTRSVFASTDLARRLTQLGATHLVITGIQTEQCCETTARDAGDRGYTVDFVTEATATFPIPHWNGGPTLGTDDITRRTEYALAGRFARIRTADDVIRNLEPLAALA